MKLEERFPLNRLVALSLGGSLLMPLTLVSVILVSIYSHVPSSTTGIALLFAGSLLLPAAVAQGATIAGRNAIRRGLMDERWPPAERNRQYQQLRSNPWKWLVGILLVSAVILPFLSLLHLPHHRHTLSWGALVYFSLAPVMARTELMKLLAPPREPVESLFLHSMKPVQSAHWGDRESLSQAN